MHRLTFAALLLVSVSTLPAQEIYREDFTANGALSKVGWSVWHKDAATGLIIDDTTKTSGDRANVYTSYAGKPISHLASSINADNSPTLIFTTEFSFDLTQGSITSFQVGRFFQDTPGWATEPVPDFDTLQLALRVDDQWYIRVETIVAARDASTIAYNTGVTPPAEIAFDAAGWAPIDFALGTAPVQGAATTLPSGMIDAFGFYLVAGESGNPGSNTTRDRIDYVVIEGALTAVPEPAATAAAFGAVVLAAGLYRRRFRRI